MPNATYEQTNFLGGEWSPAAQGRSDDPRYSTALAGMRNAYPTEQGAWTRRDGSMGIIPTRNRNYAKLLGLESLSSIPYILEFTDGSMRIFYGTSPTFTQDAQVVSTTVYSGGEFDVTTAAAHGWSVGDDVMLWFAADKAPADEGGFRGLVLQCMSGTTGSTLVLGDEIGNGLGQGFTNPVLDGSETAWRIQRKSTAINSTNYPTTLDTVLQQLRCIQTDSAGLIVQGNLAPQSVTITTQPSGAYDAQFSIAAAAFLDGPYAAMETGGGTVSALSGTITYTPNSGTFVADDVGKHIRLLSEPAAWASGTTYSAGALVKYQGAYYSSTQGSNTGNTPGAPTVVSGVLSTFWNPVLNVQRWVWGTISAQSGSACTVILGTDLSTVNGAPVGATNVIPTANGTSSITAWQRGLWSASNGYPINGCFHEGRLFLLGPVGNRWDASVSNSVFTYSPTDQYGNVNDNSALSEILNSADNLYWAKPDDRGIVVGALKGEWLISAGTGEDPLTPNNAKARRVTKYRCAPIEPVEMGQSLIFAQFYKKHLFEYLIDSFSNRFQGKPLNDMDMPLTDTNLAELAATLEPTPRCWARTESGALLTCTYRRISRFITEAPVFDAMNPHSIGDGRIVETLVAVSNPGGGDTACQQLLDPSLPLPSPTANGDYLYMVTNDAPDSLTGGSANNRMVEVIIPQKEGDNFALAWNADQVPGGGKHLVGTTLTTSQAFCTAFGGLKGSDSQTAEPADIANRAVATPGVTLPSSGATRAADLAILNNAVWFNGNTCLFKLPRISNAAGFSMSLWLNINGDNADGGQWSGPSSIFGISGVEQARGVLLGAALHYRGLHTSPDSLIAKGPIVQSVTDFASTPDFTTGRTNKIIGPAFRTDGTTWLAAGSVVWCKVTVKYPTYTKVAGLSQEIFRGAQIMPLFGTSPTVGMFEPTPFMVGEAEITGWAEPVPSEAQNGFEGETSNGVWANWEPGFVANPLTAVANGNAGWFNLLISGNAATNDFQFYINDTMIWDTAVNSQGQSGVNFPGNTFPFGDLVDWYIGGNNPAAKGAKGGRDFRPGADGVSQGQGLVAGMSELWIAPTLIDFSVAANRRKFNTSDTLLATYAPVDLGARGQTPTGSKPWVYCTGPTSIFHLNRARKNAPLAVWNNTPASGAHPETDINGNIIPGGSADQVFVDAWLGPPVK